MLCGTTIWYHGQP